MKTKLIRIAEIAKARPKEQFTSLAHLMDKALLEESYNQLIVGKAPGVDGITKEEYGKELELNIEKLHARLKDKTYKPQPVRRTYIPKIDSKEQRALGIPSLEDKIVQTAVAKILNAIYEQDFMEVSYGFRPNRSCHDALRKVNKVIMTGKVNWLVDADIKGFFDNVNHKWLMKFLEVRIRDKTLIGLINKFLKAGLVEDGKYIKSMSGTPQGGIISPILANIYLHYVLDLWFEKVVKKAIIGQSHMIRYADDYVCCFQHKAEAYRFYEALKKRLEKFGLKLAQDKSKIIEFSIKAQKEREKKRTELKSETFDFLGFTHYFGKTRAGYLVLKLKTSRKKYRDSLKRAKEWIKDNRHENIKVFLRQLGIKLLGYFRYYGVSDNIRMIDKFLYEIRHMAQFWLNKRSQRRSYTFDNFAKIWKIGLIPKPKVYVKLY